MGVFRGRFLTFGMEVFPDSQLTPAEVPPKDIGKIPPISILGWGKLETRRFFARLLRGRQYLGKT